MSAEQLHPTLWRTCRVLANTTRLRLIAQLAHKQPQSVSELAEQLALTLPVASQSLRALESRGLLKARRIGLRVEYRIPARDDAGPLVELVIALQKALRQSSESTEDLVKLATGFTHPSRIAIYRSLHPQPLTQEQIQVVTRVSFQAMSRHLRKLVSRGYIVASQDKYQQVNHPHAIGQALASLAKR
jgi:DNA-binding transcriptional ArsR family regulator